MNAGVVSGARQALQQAATNLKAQADEQQRAARKALDEARGLRGYLDARRKLQLAEAITAHVHATAQGLEQEARRRQAEEEAQRATAERLLGGLEQKLQEQQPRPLVQQLLRRFLP